MQLYVLCVCMLYAAVCIDVCMLYATVCIVCMYAVCNCMYCMYVCLLYATVCIVCMYAVCSCTYVLCVTNAHCVCVCMCAGCEFFRLYKENGYRAEGLQFDWSQVSES